MGIGSWLDRRLARGQIENAKKTLHGLNIVVELDHAYYIAVAQNVSEQLHQLWPLGTLKPVEQLLAVSQWFNAMTSSELFDRSYAILKAAHQIQKAFPARSQAMALLAHWMCMQSLAKGVVMDVRDDAGILADVYVQALEEMLEKVSIPPSTA